VEGIVNGDARDIRWAAVAAAVAWMLGTSGTVAWAQESTTGLDPLLQLNGSVESLVCRVSQSVVQVIVTSYGPMEKSDRADTDLVIGRQRSMGSSFTRIGRWNRSPDVWQHPWTHD
jgi:hypothetical protein